MEKEKTFWGIHAGQTGDAESLFEKKNVIAIGWDKMGDLSTLHTRADVKKRYEQAYPEHKTGAIPVNSGQLYRFVHEMKIGDIVIFPLKRTPEIWLGKVTGDYRYDSNLEQGYPNLRSVEWLKKYPQTKFSQGALYEIGSAMSFFQVKNYADEFDAALEGRALSLWPTPSISLVCSRNAVNSESRLHSGKRQGRIAWEYVHASRAEPKSTSEKPRSLGALRHAHSHSHPRRAWKISTHQR